jgi:hypothetical protein
VRTHVGRIYRIASRERLIFPPGRGAACVLVCDDAGHLTAVPLRDVAAVEPDAAPEQDRSEEAIPA